MAVVFLLFEVFQPKRGFQIEITKVPIYILVGCLIMKIGILGQHYDSAMRLLKVIIACKRVIKFFVFLAFRQQWIGHEKNF